MKGYRVRRPKQFDELLNLLKDKEDGVFSTLKSALVFASAVGFKQKTKFEFSETGEPIAFTLFNEHQDQPFIFSLALTEYDDVSYLQEDRFLDVMKNFEEYAAGGLQYLEGALDKTNLKESIEGLLSDTGEKNLIDDIATDW